MVPLKTTPPARAPLAGAGPAARERRLAQRAPVGAALSWALAWTIPAAAHGRFPEAGQIAVDPSSPDRLWVRTTYGLVTTEDGGAQWRWICPEGVGFDGDKEDPPVAFLADGTAIVGTFDGLSVSRDGCDFAFDPLLEGRYVIDLAAEAGATSAVAVSSNGVAADTFEVKLFDTSDLGAGWSELGSSPPSDFLAVTLGLAPSDPQRIYLTGRDGLSGSYAGVVMRSSDRGQTWSRLPVPGADGGAALPYMGAVDPDDPDRVYVAVIERAMNEVVSFALLVTEDAGESWTPIFERPQEVSGFALSPDGAEVALAGPDLGLWLASRGDAEFTQVNDIHASCLTWVSGGLYACADQFRDGHNVAVSTDAGQSFTPLSEMSSPCGPPACAASSSVGDTCPARWPEEKLELDAQDCDAGEGGGAAQGGGAAAADAGGDEGCGCAVVGAPRPLTLGGYAALALLAGLWRRRRGR